MEGLLDAYLTSPGRHYAIGETSLAEDAEEVAARFSALFAIRSYLRSPGELIARLTGTISTMAPQHGEHEGFREATYAEYDLRKVEGYVRQFGVGGHETEALEETIEQLRQSGIDVALVDLPVLEGRWSRLHEGGERDVAQYRQVLSELGTRHDIPVFRYGSLGEDKALFGDWIHLNGAGSTAFTSLLASDLVAWIQATGGQCPITTVSRGEMPPTRSGHEAASEAKWLSNEGHERRRLVAAT